MRFPIGSQVLCFQIMGSQVFVKGRRCVLSGSGSKSPEWRVGPTSPRQTASSTPKGSNNCPPTAAAPACRDATFPWARCRKGPPSWMLSHSLGIAPRFSSVLWGVKVSQTSQEPHRAGTRLFLGLDAAQSSHPKGSLSWMHSNSLDKKGAKVQCSTLV